MLRSVASKVAWVGRTASMVFGLALVLALVFGVATTALSATGGKFILGKANAAGTPSSLTASIAKPTLTLLNKSTDAAATALNISVDAGNPPLKVNATAGTATNLSADKLDGKDSTEFAADANKNGKADAAEQADNATNATNAGNADTVDGKDSTELRGARAYARVVSDGTAGTFSFDPNLTSGFTGVERASASGGVYCLTPASGISPRSLPAVVSVDHRSTASPQGNAVAMVGTDDLCDADKFQVVTQRQFISGGGSLLSSDANNVSFTIIVP